MSILGGKEEKGKEVVGEGLHAVYVDDQLGMREFLPIAFRGLFDSPIVVVDQTELVLDQFEKEKDRPNVLFTDTVMPGRTMQGIELIQVIKGIDPSIITVMVTGGVPDTNATTSTEVYDLDITNEQVMKDNKIDFYLLKPFNRAQAIELVEKIKELQRKVT